MSKEFICKGCGEKFNKDMQSNNVGYCYICNEFYMRKQVSDLEAKLAESEKDDFEYLYDKGLEKIANLKEKLAENEKKMAEKLINQEKEYLEQLKKQTTLYYRHLKEKDQEIDQLKQQLIEKDKEIEKVQEYNDRLAQGIYHSYGEHFISKVKQDKILFCIDKLEEVKEEFISEVWDLYDTADLLEQVCELRNEQIKFIDNQIKQLKEIENGK